MALLSDLVRIVAKVEGLDEVSVGIFARHAREAGHITQGGRGRSAAKMSFRDAANLLIAVNGCSLAKNVPEDVIRFRNLEAVPSSAKNAIEFGEDGATFGDQLEKLIEIFWAEGPETMRGDIPGQTFVRFYRPEIKAEITINPYVNGKFRRETIVYGEDREEYDPSAPDRSDETVISHATLRAVARAL